MTYYAVEQPFRRQGWLVRRPVRGLGMGVALACASFAVAIAVSHVAGISGGTPASAAPKAAPHVTVSYAGIRRLVAAAAHPTTLPKDVAPSLARAHDDNSGTAPRRATAAGSASTPGSAWSPHEATKPMLPCNSYGAPAKTAKKTVVLYGDSHANMWLPAFEPIARAHHWKLVLFTKPGCPPEDYDGRSSSRRSTRGRTWSAPSGGTPSSRR